MPTKENPADIGSRGLRPSDIEGIKPWLEGPSWLRTGRGTWPLGPGNLQAQPLLKDLEIKKINAVRVLSTINASDTPGPPPLQNLFQRYSSLNQLRTSTAWLLRLRQTLKTKSKLGVKSKNPLSAEEMDLALIQLIRAAQWACFPLLMQALTSCPPLKNRELESVAKKQQRSMRELSPFTDEFGLLRVGGRLQRAGFSYEKTHPLILPRRHHLTGLLVQHHHEEGLHQGYNFVLARLRDRFWVIGGTNCSTLSVELCALP